MSVEVTIEYWPQSWIRPRGEAYLNHYFGRPPNNNHWFRMCSSPDNFPASLQIAEEWLVTDQNNAAICGVHWKNGSDQWVGFRPKVVVVPHEDWD
jgi:hypothetical protein